MSARPLEGLVLAGGEGSRLAPIGLPKPLVPLAGEPLIVHAVRALVAAGCQPVRCLVREPFAAAATAAVRGIHPEVTIVACRTPSSLHTLELGLRAAGGPWLVTMVDTVMPTAAWEAFASRARVELDRGLDVLLGITSFVDDETPLRVRLDEDQKVTGIGSAGQRTDASPWVTAGVYALSSRVAAGVPRALESGISRMRGFLGWALGHGLAIGSVALPMVVDVDRPHDLDVACRMLGLAPRSGRDEGA